MNFGATPGRTFVVFSSKSSHVVPLWARSSFFPRSRQFSGPGLADKCEKTITEITGGPNVWFFASNFANSELSSGSCEITGWPNVLFFAINFANLELMKNHRRAEGIVF